MHAEIGVRIVDLPPESGAAKAGFFVEEHE